MFSSSSSTSNSTADASTLRRNRILSSKLYLTMPLSKVPLIYSTAYDISFLGMEKLHPFDSSKWGRICRFLIVDGVLDKNSIVEPLEASKDDLLVVHAESYLSSLKSSPNVAMIIVVMSPLSHYFPIVLCSKKFFTRFASRVMIIDLDAHQGNGHERDFANDRRVYILDMYNPEIYPFDHEARRYIDQKVEVVSGTTTDEYLVKLDEALTVAGKMFDPELVVFNAGTDILDGDPLGRLKISPDGITSRDEKVFRFAREKNASLVMLTSGGYMKSSARVIADSIANLSKQTLINLKPCRE